VFGEAQRRSGYSFADCHNAQAVDRIKERYPFVYGKTNMFRNKLIGKEFARGIVVEIVKGKKVSWSRFNNETNTNQRSTWLSWMEKCIEKKVVLLGKTITKVKLEEGVKDLMKGERKMKRKFESGVGVGKVGEINPSFESNKLELGELMNIVGLELESFRAQFVKLKK